ncbi:proteasome activator [Nonomuraea sp. NPDC002799]
MTATPGPSRPHEEDDGVRSGSTSAETEIARIEEPARLLRMSAMVRTLLEEVRGLSLDEHAREQLRRIHTQAVAEIAGSVAPELRGELERLLPEPSDPPSESEVRIMQSQMVGWLDGVFQGIKAGLALQQAERGAMWTPHPDLPVPGVPPEGSPYL